MLDAAAHSRLVVEQAPGLPIDRLVLGRDVDEVAALLPRLFNLCRSAQSAAVESALGRSVDLSGISEEIIRDHLLKFHVTWPAFFGHPPRPLPDDWAAGGAGLRRAIFGPAGAAPTTAADFFSYLDSDTGYAIVLKKIDGCFAAGEAVANGLAFVTEHSVWTDTPVDNSVAARVGGHPAMLAIEKRRGRGPLWRAAARLFDLDTIARGKLPAVASLRPGEAMVPAARGSYAVRIGCDGKTVTEFQRRTPTDHLLMENGVLDRTLASLPAHKAGLGPLLLDILDPCSPVRLREVRDA